MMRIAALDAAALQGGLAAGMALAAARARSPELDVRPLDRVADAADLRACAETAERYSPLVACDGADGLMLDITGCAHLFGGEAGLAAQAQRCFFRLGLQTRAVVAGTPDAARALCRFGGGQVFPLVVPPGGEEAAAGVLPVGALEAGAESLQALTRAGLRTLADLASRPSVLLAARFGAALPTRLARILGREDIRITPLRPLAECRAEQQFPEPLQDSGSVLQVLSQLARDVCETLAQRGAGGRCFEISLFRCDGQMRRIAIETSAPCRDQAALDRLMQMRLATLTTPLDCGFGFDLIRLAVSRTESLSELQSSLDSRAADEGRLSALLDQLVIRFGRDRVLQFAAGDSHDPERAAALVPLTAGGRRHGWPRPAPGEPPTRPLQLFSPPQPIEALAEVPDGPPLRFRWRRVVHDIIRREGPERLAPEWWLAEPGFAATRDYYRVEDRQGLRFWVFRDGLYEQSGSPRWYLHGLFA